MINIGICDSDALFRQHLQIMIRQAVPDSSKITLRFFETCQEVINAIREERFLCNLLFLDILSEDGEGLKVARFIYDNHVNADIIFVTASKEHIYECCRYHTFAYLIKPVSKDEIFAEMNRYMMELEHSSRTLPINIKGTIHRIPFHSILYLESNLRKLIIHTTKARYEFYGKLDEFEETLQEEGFLRCHQSYLVNRNQIAAFNGSKLIVGKDTIPVSRKYQPKIKNCFAELDIAATREYESLHQKQQDYGGLVCIAGIYLASIIYVKPEQEIFIGRDGKRTDIVINLPQVSRMHCSLIYHADTKCYELTDYSSSGTFLDEDKRLVPEENYLLQSGSILCFGDKNTKYQLI